MADTENMEKYLFVKSSMVSLKTNLVKKIFVCKSKTYKDYKDFQAYLVHKVLLRAFAAKTRLSLLDFKYIYFDLFYI